jgi:hypothetical protein
MFAMRKLTAARPRSRHSFRGFVRMGDDAGPKQEWLVRSGGQSQTLSESKRSWRAVAANIATVIGARTPAGSAPRILVMEAIDKPSPKQRIGQR